MSEEIRVSVVRYPDRANLVYATSTRFPISGKRSPPARRMRRQHGRQRPNGKPNCKPVPIAHGKLRTGSPVSIGSLRLVFKILRSLQNLSQ